MSEMWLWTFGAMQIGQVSDIRSHRIRAHRYHALYTDSNWRIHNNDGEGGLELL